MKSRYVAYVDCNSKYIMHTTHEENKDFKTNKDDWSKDILSFCNQATFEGLEIIEFIDGIDESYVTFKASIFMNNSDQSFTEKSKFIKVNGFWKYYSAEFLTS